jgi:ABC-type glycerol-3-phosphate transport system substrate-binding protein
MRTIRVWLVLGAVALGLAGPADAAQLTWWSHWAVEDSKKAVLFEAKRRFEAKHLGHTVEITFYEKKNMWPALRAAFTAGSGFPDVFYYDMDVPEFIGTGWLADLSGAIRWENIEPYGKAFWTRPGPGGKVGTWAIPVEAASDEIYYNKPARDHGPSKLCLLPGRVQRRRRQVRQGRECGVRYGSG